MPTVLAINVNCQLTAKPLLLITSLKIQPEHVYSNASAPTTEIQAYMFALLYVTQQASDRATQGCVLVIAFLHQQQLMQIVNFPFVSLSALQPTYLLMETRQTADVSNLSTVLLPLLSHMR